MDDLLREMLRTDAGAILFEYLNKIRERQCQEVLSKAQWGTVGDVRFAAGQRDGVLNVITNLLKVRKGDVKKGT